MPTLDDLVSIIERLQKDEKSEEHLTALQQILAQIHSMHELATYHQSVQQDGKYNNSFEETTSIGHIGDRVGFDSEDVAALLIRLYQFFQIPQYLATAKEVAKENQPWIDLAIDEQSISFFAHKINGRLTRLEEIHQLTQLSEEQLVEFNKLKSRLQELRNIDCKLEEIAEVSKQLLQRAIQELADKLQEIGKSQQNHLMKAGTQICMQDQLNALTQFQLELEEGIEVANWIEQHLVELTARIAKEALNTYPEIRNAATEKQTRVFKLTVKQFTERLIQCLKSGDYDSLEMPPTPVVLDERLYQTAFEYLRKILPHRLPENGIEQLIDYTNCLIANLPSYSRFPLE